MYAPGSIASVAMVIDGLMIGVLRGGPNAFLDDWTFDPYLNATYYTWLPDVERHLVQRSRSTASRRPSPPCSRCGSSARAVVPSIGDQGQDRSPTRDPSLNRPPTG